MSLSPIPKPTCRTEFIGATGQQLLASRLAAVMQRCANTLEKNYEDYNQ